MHGFTFHLAPCQCSSPSTSTLQVFLCLVEGCARKFCTVEERKQHLTGGRVHGWAGGLLLQPHRALPFGGTSASSAGCSRVLCKMGALHFSSHLAQQSAADHHKFPRHFHFDRLHLK